MLSIDVQILFTSEDEDKHSNLIKNGRIPLILRFFFYTKPINFSLKTKKNTVVNI